MESFEGIKIKKYIPVDPKDPKGVTYDWCKGETGLQVTICKRKKGIIFGNHYHKGEDPSKNPEKIFLINGKVRMKAENKLGQRFDIIIEEDCEIIIQPNVLHIFEALTDVAFIEYRSTVYDKEKPDTYPANTYKN